MAEENNVLSAQNLLVPDVYRPLFETVKETDESDKEAEHPKYRYFVLASGRLSGKTSALVFKWWVNINKFRDRDIVILQATTTEIKDSLIVEIEKFLRNSGFDVGDSPDCEWYIPKSKDKIVRKGQTGQTYFFALTDSNGGQRTRGITTANKLSLVLYEEAQKNKDANIITQSITTFIRQLDRDAQLIVVGNNETIGHWFIDFVNEKRQDRDWCYIYSNCYNIWGLLNDQTKRYIENFKKANPTEFRRIFLGDIHANTSDVVFPQFTREKNYKQIYEIRTQTIVTLIIGIDHATANDTYAVVPVAVLEDGTTQTLEVMYDDPKETQRTLSPIEQCDMLEEFMDFLDDKYGIAYNRLPVILSVDCAASPFIAQLRHTQNTAANRRLWRSLQIHSFTFKKKDTNLGIIKNAFAYGVLTILNEGMYDWRHQPNKHRLVKEIERQRYKNGKLNPEIPNDLCDALEYALVPYYTNCYNLSFPVRMREWRNAHYEDIQKLANIKTSTRR